jgi:hypothetical protein
VSARPDPCRAPSARPRRATASPDGPPAVTPRTLILLGKTPRPDLLARIAAGDEPRAEYLELARRLRADVLDFGDVDRSRHPLVRLLARTLGARWGLAALGARRHSEYDALYTTGEDVGIPLAFMLRWARVEGKLTMVAHHADTPRRRTALRALGDRVFRRVICLCGEQARALSEGAGIPARIVRNLPYWIDTHFFRPEPHPPGDFVLAVGMEGRDYAKLERAAGGLPFRVHVVASGWSPGPGYAAAPGIQTPATSPSSAAFQRLACGHSMRGPGSSWFRWPRRPMRPV